MEVTELPCSGKTDAQYMLHAIEGGARGLLVVACAHGRCRLSQGNYRAEIRMGTVRRLLKEIGLDAERAALVHCPESADVEALIRESVTPLCALEESPLCLAGKS